MKIVSLFEIVSIDVQRPILESRNSALGRTDVEGPPEWTIRLKPGNVGLKLDEEPKGWNPRDKVQMTLERIDA